MKVEDYLDKRIALWGAAVEFALGDLEFHKATPSESGTGAQIESHYRDALREAKEVLTAFTKLREIAQKHQASESERTVRSPSPVLNALLSTPTCKSCKGEAYPCPTRRSVEATMRMVVGN